MKLNVYIFSDVYHEDGFQLFAAKDEAEARKLARETKFDWLPHCDEIPGVTAEPPARWIPLQ